MSDDKNPKPEHLEQLRIAFNDAYSKKIPYVQADVDQIEMSPYGEPHKKPRDIDRSSGPNLQNFPINPTDRRYRCRNPDCTWRDIP